MSKCEGLGGITAEVVAHSNCDGTALFTMQLKYPRFIHAEFMTHRMFSRNASSSRAIPFEKLVIDATATPVHWGKNQPGMQAREEISDEAKEAALLEWNTANDEICDRARDIHRMGVHKQVVNRLYEPFQFIHVVVTATEWQNFFDLRLHEDAQPEIHELARCIKEAQDASVHTALEHDEWHLPYITSAEMQEYHLEELRKMSVARCARVSYKNHDQSNPDVNKDVGLHDILLASGHMSPFEHQATPMVMNPVNIQEGEEGYGFWMADGVTHFDRTGAAWSGNFKDWVQYRQTL